MIGFLERGLASPANNADGVPCTVLFGSQERQNRVEMVVWAVRGKATSRIGDKVSVDYRNEDENL
jgi:hypothetical protein